MFKCKKSIFQPKFSLITWKESVKKLKYLKKPRILKLEIKLIIKNSFLLLSFDVLYNFFPIIKSIIVEIANSEQNRQSQ